LYLYKVQYSSDGISWFSLPDVPSNLNSTSIIGLQPDTEFWFRVRGENGGTVGQDTSYMNLNWATIKIHTSAAVVADPPTSLVVSGITTGSYTLDWKAPTFNGGASITDFIVEISRDNGLTWQSVKSGTSTSTSLTVSGASPGTTYLVRVAAMNAVGQSEWLTGSVNTLSTTASAPRSLSSSNLGSNSVSLGWGLPDSNGGSAITDYQVEVTSNGSNSWTVIPHAASNQLGFNVSNLLSGRTYQFRVAAVTSVGLGDYSNVITITTLGGITPNAPTGLTVGSIKTNATSLSWSSVIATSKVTNYLVDVSTDGTSWVPVSKKVSTSTSLGLSGLKLGTTYQVRVAAVNANGTGDYVYGSFTTLATVSTAPTGLVYSGVSGSGFTLNWNAPSTNGGSAITDYVVEINGGGYTWSPLAHDPSNNTSITITGLNPGVKYSVRVKALNSVGISKASSNLNVTTLAVAPSAPV
ncbi:MAG: fibronectin type III domain-containing protein, partial [Microbacteriaceae bacterium]|nr:fibronectin type III domain-containing protein [Microbacteriaceae bacterium]